MKCNNKEIELYLKGKQDGKEELQQEIDRLNKIIYELEKYIINHYYIDDWEEEVVLQKDLLNKLQELKEEGK